MTITTRAARAIRIFKQAATPTVTIESRLSPDGRTLECQLDTDLPFDDFELSDRCAYVSDEDLATVAILFRALNAVQVPYTVLKTQGKRRIIVSLHDHIDEATRFTIEQAARQLTYGALGLPSRFVHPDHAICSCQLAS